MAPLLRRDATYLSLRAKLMPDKNGGAFVLFCLLFYVVIQNEHEIKASFMQKMPSLLRNQLRFLGKCLHTYCLEHHIN